MPTDKDYEANKLRHELIQAATDKTLTVEKIEEAIKTKLPIDFGKPNSEGVTILMAAASQGLAAVVIFLLTEKSIAFDVQRTIDKRCLDFDSTAFFHAVKNNHLLCIIPLITAGADPTLPCDDRMTPLLMAVQCGYVEMTALLLGVNTVQDSLHEQGGPALFLAAKYGSTGCLRMLISLGVKPNHGWLALLLAAAENGHREVITYLLTLEPVKALIQNSRDAANVACHAAEYGHWDCLLVLAGAGVDLRSARRYDSSTPLMVAARQGVLSTLQFLLNKGEQKNPQYEAISKIVRSPWGSLAVYYAAENGHLDCVKELVTARADPFVPRLDGSTALSIAEQHDERTIVKFLLQEREKNPYDFFPLKDQKSTPSKSPRHSRESGNSEKRTYNP